MDALITEGWRIYQDHRYEPFVVRPSLPILFFGDLDAYQRSPLRVATVGLNPSYHEFPADDPFKRFRLAREVYPDLIDGHRYHDYLAALNAYFRSDPYRSWFSSFEPLLNGLGSSFYGNRPSTALHTDLLSPLATLQTWSKLPRSTQVALETSGIPLWHGLIAALRPDVIVFSVAERYLHRVQFISVNGWEEVHTIPRNRPYTVRAQRVLLPGATTSFAVFGRAAQKPFGSVSTRDKHEIGALVLNHIPS